MKNSLFLLCLFCCSFWSFAQDVLQVQSNEKGLFLTHTVAPKENFFSVGRLYNVQAKDIATFNNLDMAKGLTIGKTVMIPLSASNFSQEAANGRPVYYIVGEKEGLYRVSLKNNKVLMANLRKWNNLATDNINTGQKLIVGYLVSAEANNISVTNLSTPVERKAEPPVAHREPPAETIKPKQDETPKPAEKKPEPVAAKPVSNPVPAGAVKDANGGYFKGGYEAQVKSQPASKDETVTAGIFKTASGWQDAKYYALMDGAEPGTIIRIINPSNNKAVYAKVLGPMAGIRQNQGYDLRLSNAAASALEVSDPEKFVVRVNY
jgi:LysM repeat protein